MGDRTQKSMFINQKIKIKRAQIRTSEFLRKLHQQAKKIALAVVITEFIIAGSYAGLVKYEVLPLKKDVVYVERVMAKEIPVEVKSEVVEDKKEITKAEEIADMIYLLESSNGKNDQKCEREGKHNGYGFRQGINKNYCLSSDDEVRKLVIELIEDQLATGMTQNQILCRYNTGKATDNCEYIENLY